MRHLLNHTVMRDQICLPSARSTATSAGRCFARCDENGKQHGQRVAHCPEAGHKLFTYEAR